MKFNVLKQDFIAPLQAVSRSVGVKATLPVLSNILLSAEGQKLKISATNLEIGVIKQIPVEVLEAGEITIPSRTLIEIVQALSDIKIEVESMGENLNLTAGKFQATINGTNPSEFPVIPVDTGGEVELEKQVLKSCSQILFAAAVDEGRPTLTGILTQATNQRLEFVATDGFRLAHRQTALKTNKKPFKSLIPRRTLEEVLRVIDEEEGEKVTISMPKNQNQIVFKVNQTIISSRLIEGNYPSWEKIIPQSSTTRAVVEKEIILQAVKLASVFAKVEGFVTLKIIQGKLNILAEAKELGSQENELEAQIEGEDLQISFNTKFLTDALSACPSSQLLMEFLEPLSPTLIRPVGVEGLQYVVMPVRTN